MRLDEFFKKYDLVHANLVNGGKVRLSINFSLNDMVELSILYDDEIDDKTVYSTIEDYSFKFFILPKIVQRFLSKGNDFSKRVIMGNEEFGTVVIKNSDDTQCMVLRNCSIDVMDFLDKMFLGLSNLNDYRDDIFINYLACNIAFDYAKYKTKFVTKIDNLSFYDYASRKKSTDKTLKNDEFTDSLAILDIARCFVSTKSFDYDVLIKELEKDYGKDKVISALCKKFLANDFSQDTIYTRAYICASFEKNNETFLNDNSELVDEALDATSSGVSYFNDDYDDYWNERSKYFLAMNDDANADICESFFESRILVYEEVNMSNETIVKDIESKDRIKNKIVNAIKKIKNTRPDFSSIINDPLEENADVETVNVNEEEKENGNTLFDEEIKKGAEEEAKELFELIKERDQIKKDAEEFAKMILKSEKERKKIMAEADEQAKIIFELQQENNRLRALADENAHYLLDRDLRLSEEERLREEIDNTPVKNSDIDKIQDLLNSISAVKDLDFAVNHPTVMQELTYLEEKIVTYLTTHVNVVKTEDTLLPLEKQEMYESKSVGELLSMIRNAYVSSHVYEKEGRHTLINVNPVDEDTYKVTLYSVKDDEDDILMDVFFEDYQLTEDVIKELCDIFKADSFIVASKTDNIPYDKADYLVIDNMNNAIKFMGCNRDLINMVKAYL